MGKNGPPELINDGPLNDYSVFVKPCNTSSNPFPVNRTFGKNCYRQGSGDSLLPVSVRGYSRSFDHSPVHSGRMTPRSSSVILAIISSPKKNFADDSASALS